MSFQLTNYVAFQVKNYNSAVEFYKQVLGFELVTFTENESKFKCGDRYFFIEKKEDGDLRTYFEFSVPDIVVAKEQLTQAGCKILWQHNEKSFGFSDPYGMCFHVFESGTDLPDL